MQNKPKQKYISLKEASKISGYSADYIGQLIRKGKIPGKQVYYNIAWMTTAEALLEYKKKEKGKKEEKSSLKDRFLGFLKESRQKFFLEIRTLKLFVKTFKYILPILIVLILTFSILLFYIFFIIKQEPELLKEIDPEKIEEVRELEY